MWRYQPNPEEEYVGNVWGWKFSLFGAALILAMLLLALGIATYRGKPLFESGTSPSTEVRQ